MLWGRGTPPRRLKVSLPGVYDLRLAERTSTKSVRWRDGVKPIGELHGRLMELARERGVAQGRKLRGEWCPLSLTGPTLVSCRL